MIKEIITTSYAILKKSKAGDFSGVKSELDLLGIGHDENSLAIAFKITQSTKSLKEALSELEKHEKSGTVNSILSEVKEEIKTNEEKKKKAAEEKKKKQEATKALAEANRATAGTDQATGGYQSSFSQDSDFMGGRGTAAEMGSFKQGGIVGLL